MQKFVDAAVLVAALPVVFYVLWRLLRPRTTRELLQRPTPFFERLQPTIEAYGDAESSEARAESLEDARRVFARALVEHGLPPNDFRLELTRDELGLGAARVQRVSGGDSWSIGDFDDYLLSKPLSELRAKRVTEIP